MMSEGEILGALRQALGDGVLGASGSGFDSTVMVSSKRAPEALACLKEMHFNVLIDYTAADLLRWPGAGEERFELTWRLMSLDVETGLVRGRLALKCRVPEGAAGPPSARGLWPNADWLEREVWDMFGVKPADRPDLKRLLLYPEFKGHPLRKDYPINKRQPLIEPLKPPVERIAPDELRPKITP